MVIYDAVPGHFYLSDLGSRHSISSMDTTNLGPSDEWPASPDPSYTVLLARLTHLEPSLVVSILLNLSSRGSNKSKVEAVAFEYVET